jgi:hypothetical protein
MQVHLGRGRRPGRQQRVAPSLGLLDRFHLDRTEAADLVGESGQRQGLGQRRGRELPILLVDRLEVLCDEPALGAALVRMAERIERRASTLNLASTTRSGSWVR